MAICTSSSFEEAITERSLNYAYMNDELVLFIRTDEGRETIESARNLFGWFKTAVELMKKFKPIMRRMLDEEWAAAQDSDAIVYHPKAAGGLPHCRKAWRPRLHEPPIASINSHHVLPLPCLPQFKTGRLVQQTYLFGHAYDERNVPRSVQ